MHTHIIYTDMHIRIGTKKSKEEEIGQGHCNWDKKRN